MTSTTFFTTVALAVLLSAFLPTSSTAAKDGGADQPNNVPPQSGAAAPRERLLEEANLEGLANMVILTGQEATQAASYFGNYVFVILDGTTRDNIPRSTCFIAEREGETSDNTDTNYLQSLVEDYRGALGYSSYMQILKEHFCQEPSRSQSYCAYQGDLQRTVDTMTQSLANLVRFVNESAYLSAIGLQSSDHKDGETTTDRADSALPDHCTDPCYEQQASVITRLETLASKYIPTDVNGFLGRTEG